MRTGPHQLVEILKAAHFEEPVALRSSDFQLEIRKIEWAEAYDLAYRGEIEAISKKSRIKYFRLLPESERPELPPSKMKREPVFKTREPLGAALHPYYEDKCGEYLVPTLCKVTKNDQLVRWHPDARFPKGRFNPDKIAPALRPGLRRAA